jgi:Zn-dependent protease with chaperone function
VIELSGDYFDGRSSRRHPARLLVHEDGQVRLVLGDGREERALLDAVEVAPRLADATRALTLPGGGRFETRENDAVDALQARQRRGRGARFLHLLESRWRVVLPTLLFVAVCVWAFAEHGIPALAREAATRLPASTSEVLGEGALESLDRTLFEPSRLDGEIRERLEAGFTRLLQPAADGPEPRLVFRRGGSLGANALALPSGVVVLTDELVALAQADEELVAVLAHELGHVHGRHALRRLLQSSLVAGLAILVTGDVASATSLIAAVPTTLAQAGYSRDLEREADAYALELLDRHGIDRQHFARILGRLAAQPGGDLPGFLATHPTTEERVRALAAPR